MYIYIHMYNLLSIDLPISVCMSYYALSHCYNYDVLFFVLVPAGVLVSGLQGSDSACPLAVKKGCLLWTSCCGIHPVKDTVVILGIWDNHNPACSRLDWPALCRMSRFQDQFPATKQVS